MLNPIRRKTHHVQFIYAVLLAVMLLITSGFTYALVNSDQVDAPLTVQMVVPAPTATPTPQNHCLMLETGICYIVFPAHCVPGTPEIYGPESMGVPVTCSTVKGK